MSKVFFSVLMSLDGFIAPEGMDLEHADDPSHNDWLAQWMALQQWVFQQRFFRESLRLGEGGETGRDNRMLQELYARDEFSISVSPVVFGTGVRLFEGIDRRRVSVEAIETIHSPLVTHLRYAVRRN